MNKNIVEIVQHQLPMSISTTNFNIGKKYQGKVRDVYEIGNNKILIIATDRISAFDKVLGIVPFKGEILTNLSMFWFNNTNDIIPNHIIQQIHSNAIIVKKCKIVPIEVIIRGYLTGGGWREYLNTGKISGISLVPNLRKDTKFDKPIFTPTTKAISGHDEPITKEEIINRKIISKNLLDKIEDIAYKLYYRGSEIARKNNLILVDTKYEFGLLDDGTVILADEIHTPDSSRYWFMDSYHELYVRGKDQRMLDKEYFRQWLLSKNYQGEGIPPQIPFEIIVGICEKYLAAYEHITGEKYLAKNRNTLSSLIKAVKTLQASLTPPGSTILQA